MNSQAIEAILSGFSAWKLVANKVHILNMLSSRLKPEDHIQGILEGFLEETNTGGLFLLTDNQFIFVPGEKGKNPLQILYKDIKKLSTEKTFSAHRLSIGVIQKDWILTTFSGETALNQFTGKLSSLSGQISMGSSQEGEKSGGILPDFGAVLNQLTKSADKTIYNLSNQMFIFNEAKNIRETILPYRKIQDGIILDQITEDFELLSALCLSSKTAGSEEKFLLSLVMLILREDKSPEWKKLSNKIFSDTLFSPENQEALDLLWQNKDFSIFGGRNILTGLASVRKYDAAGGTNLSSALEAVYNRFSQCLVKANGKVTPEEEVDLKNITALIQRKDESTIQVQEEKKEETLSDVLKEIDGLIGMQNIRDEIKTFVNLVKIQKERQERQLPLTPLSLHAVFYGPPGTGKTTIARILGRVYKCLGLLKKGHLVETDRAGLVAGFVGQTAIKTDEMVQKAADGVLFIDEAYTLSGGKGAGNDYGREAIDTLLKRMEDLRDKIAVIVAGYPDEMKEFINSNPGLKSRFSRYFNFQDYKPEELVKIFEGFCKKAKYQLSDAATKKILALLNQLYLEKDRTFGNGRLARNLFEKTVEKQANRIAGIIPLTDEILCTFEEADIPAGNERI